MKVIDSFDATPNTNLLDVLGNSGYSLQAAIADIVDNSITAKAKNIYINACFKNEDSYISIVDDGIGMNLEKLKQASIIAFKDMFEERSIDDLGRFSTGINSASASMCKHLIIQSRSKNDEVYHTISINYQVMKESKNWMCNVVETETNYLMAKTGTAIVWNNLKEISNARNQAEFYSKMEIVEKHLSHVFNDYISKGVNIFINKHKIDGWDPFFKRNLKTTITYDDKHEYKNSVIQVKIFILPPYNSLSQDEQDYMRGYGLSEQQGFYIFRNNRLIKEGTWLGIEGLGISNKYDYARIRVDIDSTLDSYFKPNFLKNELYIPDDLILFFKKIANNARKESHKSFNYMKAPSIIRSTKQKNHISVWNYKTSKDGLLLSINEDHPIIKSLCKEMSDSNRKKLFKLISSNLPIGEISRSGLSKMQNQYQNIDIELNEMYDQFKEEGLNDLEIFKRMASCEPFCSNQELLSELIEFFSNKGVI